MPNDFVSSNAQSLNKWFDERFALKMDEWHKNRTRSLSMLVTRGTLDWAYPPFIIGSTAKALGWDVTLFFTFYGLGLLKRNLDLKISALGNPAMPMKMPFGPPWFRNIEWNMPNLVMAAVPGQRMFLCWELDAEEEWTDGSVGTDWLFRAEQEAALKELGALCSAL